MKVKIIKNDSTMLTNWKLNLFFIPYLFKKLKKKFFIWS